MIQPVVRKYKNYNFEPVKNARKILWPFAIPYDGVTRLRNYLFDQSFFDSYSYDFPVIGIGNLSTGGTGKSPMTEYVVSLLKDTYCTATLSRGYGRDTKGYLEVTPDLQASDTGDEPLQFARKFRDVRVAVCEDRVVGISKLRDSLPQPELIVLDDVYQHRKVKPGLLILLTAFDDLFYNDFVLPAGNLRESRQGADRADCVVVTKCPQNLSIEKQQEIQKKISIYTDATVYFATINYGKPQSKTGVVRWDVFNKKQITVVTGIAKPKPFLKYLDKEYLSYTHLQFADHHNFSDDELKKLDEYPVILTTEKDFVRLNGKLNKAALFYIPITFNFHRNTEEFNRLILNFAQSNSVRE